ncbi:hypothetical protein N9N67_07765 [Bacteriovoracaceae bacterium]|nr:hypothetical protein [Bacteriovoracaceae bacterium]
MSNLTFKVLLILGNESLGIQISQKIKQDLNGLPLEVDYVTDSRRGIADFRDKMHQLIIVDDELPGTSGAQIIREIRKIVGGVTILLLTNKQQEILESGVEQVILPIVNWSDFLGKSREVIPEELKAKFGFLKRDSLFFKKLENYSKSFIQNNNLDDEFEKYKTEKPLSLIPKYFDSMLAPKTTSDEKNLDIHNSDSTKNGVGEIKVNSFLEIFVLLMLIGATIGVHKLEYFSSEELISLKNIISAFAVIAFSGFFASKVFDRFFINRL